MWTRRWERGQVAVLNVLTHAKSAAARLDRALSAGADGDAALAALFQSYR
jgi:hypothetical protein